MGLSVGEENGVGYEEEGCGEEGMSFMWIGRVRIRNMEK